MEGRGTAHMIEPEIYTIYMLTLKHGISPQRALAMWKDKGYYSSGRDSIKQIMRWHMEGYWKFHGFTNVSDKLTDPESVIEFMKKYEAKPKLFKRLFGG